MSCIRYQKKAKGGSIGWWRSGLAGVPVQRISASNSAIQTIGIQHTLHWVLLQTELTYARQKGNKPLRESLIYTSLFAIVSLTGLLVHGSKYCCALPWPCPPLLRPQHSPFGGLTPALTDLALADPWLSQDEEL